MSSAKAFNMDQSRLCCLVNDSPFPKQQTLDSSKPKEFADDNFKFDENGRRFSKLVENTVGKGEIALCEKFLLFPEFSKDLFNRHIKIGLVWEGLKERKHSL